MKMTKTKTKEACPFLLCRAMNPARNLKVRITHFDTHNLTGTYQPFKFGKIDCRVASAQHKKPVKNADAHNKSQKNKPKRNARRAFVTLLAVAFGIDRKFKKSKGSLPFLLLSASFLSLMTASFYKNYLIKAPNAAVPASVLP